ncbi:WXG100 family type VII secretion target [Nocardia sp. NPDC051750]|uniref:WXG100 family type VII secretion target n=1 Tax=Nocardia sp. NPDC051750 TaxID=3364325 RepID=UPI0037A3BF58
MRRRRPTDALADSWSRRGHRSSRDPTTPVRRPSTRRSSSEAPDLDRLRVPSVPRGLEVVVTLGGDQPSSNIIVVPEEVRTVGQFVAEIAQNLRSGLETASVEVDTLLEDGWTGDRSDEFFGGWVELRDGGLKILQALDGMAEKLGVQSDTYEAADSATSQHISSLNL